MEGTKLPYLLTVLPTYPLFHIPSISMSRLKFSVSILDHFLAPNRFPAPLSHCTAPVQRGAQSSSPHMHIGIHFECLPSNLMHLIRWLSGCDNHQLNFISKCTTLSQFENTYFSFFFRFQKKRDFLHYFEMTLKKNVKSRYQKFCPQ